MKKLLVLILVFIANIQSSYSYTLSNSDKILVNEFSKKINLKSTYYKKSFSNKIQSLINSWKYGIKIKIILWKINENIISSIDAQKKEKELIKDQSIQEKKSINTYELENIDIWIVKDNWLMWNNGVRNKLWLENYSYNSLLEKSAFKRSEQAKEKWNISHKRNIWDSYYDYNKINNWFKENWIDCENISRITHSESIWWWIYNCSDWECSDELSESIRETFDFYMSEKWKANNAHYRALTQKYFTNIWLWISVKNMQNNSYKYFLTVHYCTNLK